MDSEEMFKLSKLMDTKHLRQLFEELVETNQISEEDFWNTVGDIKYLSRKENEAKMETGVSR